MQDYFFQLRLELGLNADYTDFCGNIRLVEDIINHKAQAQGNSPHQTKFYYQQDSLKSVWLYLPRQTPILPSPNLFFDTSKTGKCEG